MAKWEDAFIRARLTLEQGMREISGINELAFALGCQFLPTPPAQCLASSAGHFSVKARPTPQEQRKQTSALQYSHALARWLGLWGQ